MPIEHAKSDERVGQLTGYAGTSPVVMLFTGDWCCPCKTLAREFEQWEQEGLFHGCQVFTVDVAEAPATAHQYGIRVVPTTVVLNGLREIELQRCGIVQRKTVEEAVNSALLPA